MNSIKRIEALKDEAIAILVQADCDGRFLTEGENKRLQEIEEEIKKMNYIKNCWEKYKGQKKNLIILKQCMNRRVYDTNNRTISVQRTIKQQVRTPR